jgi:hypothetical protein
MKKSINTLSSILTCLLFGLNSLSGQNNSTLSFSRSIELNGEPYEAELALPVKDSLYSVTFSILSSISAGQVSIEMYNPIGVRNGYTKLGGKMNLLIMKRKYVNIENKKASCSMTIKDPIRGEWKAKIKASGAYGSITLQLTNQDFK